MRNYISIIYIAVFILFPQIMIIGCGGKNETPPKAVAVSKKIVTKKSESIPSPRQVPDIDAKKDNSDTKEIKTIITGAKENDNVLIATSQENIKIRSGKITNELHLKPSGVIKDMEKQESATEIKKQETGIVSVPSVSENDIAKLQPEGTTTYNPEGKIDPFAPLFGGGVPVSKGKKMRTPRTPLEMLDLSQLKLVAVIQAKSGNKALVEEASGKGYIVVKGTYMGTNSGRIVKILNDRVIIEEEVENIIGVKKIQETELKLQKPLGEQ